MKSDLRLWAISVWASFVGGGGGGLKVSLAQIFFPLLAQNSSGFARIPDFLLENGYFKISRGGGGAAPRPIRLCSERLISARFASLVSSTICFIHVLPTRNFPVHGIYYSMCIERSLYLVSWEPEGRYCSSKMFCWGPEGHCCTVYGDSALLVLSGTYLICNNALLALDWRSVLGMIFLMMYTEGQKKLKEWRTHWNPLQWNLFITRSLGPWKLPCYIRFLIIIGVKKQRNIKSWEQQNYLVIRGFCYIRPLYNEVPLYIKIIIFGHR